MGPTGYRRRFNRTKKKVRDDITRKTSPGTGTSGVGVVITVKGDVSKDTNQERKLHDGNTDADLLARWVDIQAGRMPGGEPVFMPDAEDVRAYRDVLIRDKEEEYADPDSELASENRRFWAEKNEQADEKVRAAERAEDNGDERRAEALKAEAKKLRAEAHEHNADVVEVLDKHAKEVRKYRESGAAAEANAWKNEQVKEYNEHLEELREGLKSEIAKEVAGWGMELKSFEF